MNQKPIYDKLDKKNKKLVEACPKIFLDNEYWFDISEAYLDGELLYLKYRNILKRHPKSPWLVQVL